MQGRDFDYLAVGHLCQDITPDGWRLGGSAAYAGLAADALGCRAAVVTSAGPGMGVRKLLKGLHVRLVRAVSSTRFENRRAADGRREQRLFGRAALLRYGHIPIGWRHPKILHLAPVAGEVDPALLRYCAGAVKGLTPQGWLREWDQGGRVRARFWQRAMAVFPQADAVILSEEDLSDSAALSDYRRWATLLVLTQGERGCTVFCGRQGRSFPAPRVIERDATGAGDLFAAAFLIALWRDGDPWRAARLANVVAAPSVAVEGLAAKIEAVRRARPLF